MYLPPSTIIILCTTPNNSNSNIKSNNFNFTRSLNTKNVNSNNLKSSKPLSTKNVNSNNEPSIIWNKKDFLIALKKVYRVSLLPTSIDKLYNHLFVRVLRFTGGICLFLVFSHNYVKLGTPFNTVVLILATFQVIQMTCVSLIKGVNGFYNLLYKPETFEIRNQPLNRLGGHIYRILYFAKATCGTTGSALALLSGGVLFDEIRAQAGQERIFIPWLAKIYSNVFLESSEISDQREKDLIKRSTPSQDPDIPSVEELITSYHKLSDEDKSKFIEDLQNRKP